MTLDASHGRGRLAVALRRAKRTYDFDVWSGEAEQQEQPGGLGGLTPSGWRVASGSLAKACTEGSSEAAKSRSESRSPVG
ncbi:hypothetical protein [Amycolatopsis cynarae]|uniref:hypothetical protein n=1 Tax=Amycolatopsis cynarae TaxID=2995223 RepID=UPI00389904B2